MTEPEMQLGRTGEAERGAAGVAAVTCGRRPDPAHGAPPPCWIAEATDWQRLEYACAVLRRYAISAHPALGEDPETTGERLRAAILARFPDADGAYLFWTVPDDEACFTPGGQLRAPLTVYRHGSGTDAAARAALQLVALTAHPGPRPGTLTVRPRSGSFTPPDGI